MKNVLKKLLAVQQEIKAPKSQYNSFGKFSYRTCEDILKQTKPVLKEHNCVLIITDDIKQIANRFYITATVRFIDVDSGEEITNTANAREEEAKKGMDGSQITGAASSYARKYALAGLLLLDDNKDADSMDNSYNQQQPRNSRSTQGSYKDMLLRSIVAKMKKNKIGNDIMTKIMEDKYRKHSSGELTEQEASDLDTNLLTYVKELK